MVLEWTLECVTRGAERIGEVYATGVGDEELDEQDRRRSGSCPKILTIKSEHVRRMGEWNRNGETRGTRD